MEKLRDKLEELLKGLAAMKPKSAQDTLVPGLKMPGVKPLSIGAATPAAPKATKMPGMSPASGKDPKKMAEQLKNPKPMKAKIEVLKTDQNGQWSLQKDGSTHRIAMLPDKSTIDYHGDHGGYHHYEVNSPKHGKYKVSLGHPGSGKVWGPSTKPKKSYATEHEAHMLHAVGNHVNKMHGKPEKPMRTESETIDASSDDVKKFGENNSV